MLGGKKVTHHLPRTLSRFISHQGVLQEKGMCPCKVTDGQCCSDSIHQQDGKHSLSGAIQFSFRRMRLMHSSPHGGVSPTPTWASKCKSGQGSTPSARFQRLETGYHSSYNYPVYVRHRGREILQKYVFMQPLRKIHVCAL